MQRKSEREVTAEMGIVSIYLYIGVFFKFKVNFNDLLPCVVLVAYDNWTFYYYKKKARISYFILF